MANYVFEERLDWGRWVTPKALAARPVHRWFRFPHSFSDELVHALIDEWNLGPDDHVLDPFSGAGTTLLACKEKGVPASGYDILPLAALIARTKVANLDIVRLETLWDDLKRVLHTNEWKRPAKQYPELVARALPGTMLWAFDTISRSIDNLPGSPPERDFFRLALLSVLREFSLLAATGGWLKRVERSADIKDLPTVLSSQVEMMLEDLRGRDFPNRQGWRFELADARNLPDRHAVYSAVITSPPYPNRHDYTRVFGVELMFGFLDWEAAKGLRHQSVHSHPEACPARPDATGYVEPPMLIDLVEQIGRSSSERRLAPMLRGYFLDLFLCMREMGRVSEKGARFALVVGNVQYCGQMVPVDELLADIGEQVGLCCERIVVVRYRGNSAQQMGRFGRRPSRESIVIFRKEKARLE
ncbi:MAG: DNA methyltransferase [Bacillota bacterium]